MRESGNRCSRVISGVFFFVRHECVRVCVNFFASISSPRSFFNCGAHRIRFLRQFISFHLLADPRSQNLCVCVCVRYCRQDERTPRFLTRRTRTRARAHPTEACVGALSRARGHTMQCEIEAVKINAEKSINVKTSRLISFT